MFVHRDLYRLWFVAFFSSATRLALSHHCRYEKEVRALADLNSKKLI